MHLVYRKAVHYLLWNILLPHQHVTNVTSMLQFALTITFDNIDDLHTFWSEGYGLFDDDGVYIICWFNVGKKGRSETMKNFNIWEEKSIP